MLVDLMLPAAEKITLVLEGLGDDKIRVNSSSLDQPLTILADQVEGNSNPAHSILYIEGGKATDILIMANKCGAFGVANRLHKIEVGGRQPCPVCGDDSA